MGGAFADLEFALRYSEMETVKVTRTAGKLAHEVQVRSHRLITDVSESSGGEDRGPSPHEFLAAALAACTSITLRMYASRKTWPLENVETEVSVDHRGDHTTFETKIRLLEIANHCPVHKSLAGKIEISTKLV
jgi:putative redox protein